MSRLARCERCKATLQLVNELLECRECAENRAIEDGKLVTYDDLIVEAHRSLLAASGS